jgi:hypothetical protein
MNGMLAQIEAISQAHGVTLSTSVNHAGRVFTSPEWTEWPEAMLAEVRTIAVLRKGPDTDSWTAKTANFPNTLTDSENRVWTLADIIPANAMVNFARYEHAGKPAYYKGGRTLYSVRFVELDDMTVCQPGSAIASVQ